jgi:hypothetical protein
MSLSSYSEMIQHFLKKVVDGHGKWLLKTPLKDADRRELFALYETMKSEVEVIQQAIQDGAKNMTLGATTITSSNMFTKLETASLHHVCRPHSPSPPSLPHSLTWPLRSS